MKSSACAIIVGLMLATAAPDARANQGRAKRLFSAGSLAYERGQYADAVRAFEASYDAFPDPAIAFSLAQAHRRQFVVDARITHVERAVELYRLYLASPGLKRRAEEAADQIQALETIRSRVTEVVPVPLPEPPRTEVMIYSGVEGAQGGIDGEPLADLPRILEVKAGEHVVRVAAPGYVPASVDVEAVADRLTPIPIELEERPALLDINTLAGAAIFVDGEARGEAPIPTLSLPAGPHRLTVLANGTRGYATALSLKREQSMIVEAELESTAQRRAAHYTLIGAGTLGAIAAVTTIVTLSAESTASNLHNERGLRNITADELDEFTRATSRRDTFRTVSFVVGSAAVTAGIVGLLLYVLDDRELAEVEASYGVADSPL